MSNNSTRHCAYKCTEYVVTIFSILVPVSFSLGALVEGGAFYGAMRGEVSSALTFFYPNECFLSGATGSLSTR